jgi:hypothetical protein
VFPFRPLPTRFAEALRSAKAELMIARILWQDGSRVKKETFMGLINRTSG